MPTVSVACVCAHTCVFWRADAWLLRLRLRLPPCLAAATPRWITVVASDGDVEAVGAEATVNGPSLCINVNGVRTAGLTTQRFTAGADGQMTRSLVNVVPLGVSHLKPQLLQLTALGACQRLRLAWVTVLVPVAQLVAALRMQTLL